VYVSRNVEDIDEIMDDITEQGIIANEIAEAISQPIGFQDVDEVGVVVLLL